jgi:hypothetical protein
MSTLTLRTGSVVLSRSHEPGNNGPHTSAPQVVSLFDISNLAAGIVISQHRSTYTSAFTTQSAPCGVRTLSFGPIRRSLAYRGLELGSAAASYAVYSADHL